MISGPSTEVRQTLGRAEQLLRMRRTAEAAALLRRLAAEFPAHTEPLRVHALALRELGDLRAAEAQLRAAIEIDPRQPLLYVTLAEVLLRARRPEAAETQYRRALALDAGFGPAVVGLAELLLEGGRAADALEATSMAVSAAGADIAVWTVHANALKALGRHDEALPAYRRASELAPRSAVAEHNLAGVLGDMGRFAESEAAARRAFAKGGQAPETWLVHGRALMGQARLDEAEGAFRESIRRRPAYAEPVADLAQLIWMRTEDVGAACAPLNEAIQAAPSVPALRIAKSKLLEYAGDLEGAYAAVADLAAQAGADPALHLKAAQVAAAIDAPKALAHAEAAFATAPENLFIGQALCASLLAVGRADSAARLAQTLRERSPLDQYLLGLLVTAWRLLDDPRAADLADYEGLVRSQPIDTPDGWKSLEAYLSDLGESLVRMHPFQGHPLGQSLRGGSQTQHGLDRSVDPAITAFFTAIDGPIRRHLRAIGEGMDAHRVRNTGDYRLNGVWSVRLRPHGYHVDHLHPLGWISSACYIDLPSAIERGHEGWLKFGQPGVPTLPALEPQHFVKPQPGRLVLFPSYLWHGTVPFGGDQPRLTIAFDVIPA